MAKRRLLLARARPGPYTLLHTSYAWEGHAGESHRHRRSGQGARQRAHGRRRTCPASPSSPSPRSPCGSPQVGRAMLAGGARALGDSRLENAQRLRDAGLTAPHLAAARAAAGAGRRDRPAHRRLAAERARDGGRPRERRRRGGAASRRRRHGRPRRPARGHAAGGSAGVPRARQRHGPHRHRRHRRQPHLLRRDRARRGQPRPAGRAGRAERASSSAARCWSRAATPGSIGMVTSGRMPAAIDTLRIGETILLGVDTLTREPTLGLHLDAITVSAPVIECLVKPSLPRGTSAQDAFGNFPTFTDRGERRRAICALGRQDAPPEGLTPVDPRVEVLGASSDHLILDVDAIDRPPALGESHHVRAHLRCDAAAVHVTVRPQSVHSAGLTQGSWRGGTCNHRSEHGRENQSPDHGGRGPRLPQLQHLLPRRGRSTRSSPSRPRRSRTSTTASTRPSSPARTTPTASRSTTSPRCPSWSRSTASKQVVFAYSDVPYEYVMHRSALVNSLGADFCLHGPRQGHGQEHQAGDRRLRRAHRRRQEPDHAQDPDHAARGRQEGRHHPSPHALRRPRRPARAALRDARRPHEVRVHHRGDGGVRAARRGRQRDLRRRRLRGHRARGREGSRRHPLGRRQQRLQLLRRRPVHHRRRPAPSRRRPRVLPRRGQPAARRRRRAQQDRLGRPRRHRGRARGRALGEPDGADHHGRLARSPSTSPS